jgi:hypothetical protein
MAHQAEDRRLNRHVRVAPSTHEALKAAARGDMTLDDVVREALREYEPDHPDPVDVLEGGAT